MQILFVITGVIAALNPFDHTSVVKDSAISFRTQPPVIVGMDKLPNVINYTDTDANTTKTLLEVLFINNQTLMDESLRSNFRLMDADQDGKMTFAEMKSFSVRKEFNSNYFTRMGYHMATLKDPKVLSILEQEFHVLDRNTDGTVDFEEYECSVKGCGVGSLDGKAMTVRTVQIPSAYSQLCDAFIEAANTKCPNIMEGPDSDYKRAFVFQNILCRNAHSLFVENNEREVCMIEANYCKIECLRSSTAMQAQEYFDQTPTLRKRFIVPILIASFGMFVLEPWITFGLLAVITLVTLGSIAIAGMGLSAQHWKSDWLQVTGPAGLSGEKWFVGQPLPPCGTAVIWWSDACVSLQSRKTPAEKCSMPNQNPDAQTIPLLYSPQPFYENSCNNWWRQGSRSCKLFGCRPLCYGISGNGCKQHTEFNVTYVDGASRLTK